MPYLGISVALALAVAGCGDDAGGDASLADEPAADTAAPADLEAGADLYAGACSACHGTDLRGTNRGPSHLSVVYEAGHHPDGAFRAAILEGSPQHHWHFGDMPPVTGLDDAEIEAVIAYIRHVQEREGYEPYPP
jgi:mono/diheme cytochrome c family protein